MPAPDLAEGATIGAALRWAALRLAGSPTPMLDARVLIKAALGLDDAGLIIGDRRALTQQEADLFAGMIARRTADEPVAYITGVREFWSLPIAIEPGILVPRADSETLVAATLAMRASNGARRVLDLGCGSGALLCALLSSLPNATGLGVDISDRAGALTNRNLAMLGLSARGRAVRGDWTAGIGERFDLIVSNPPYIAESERGRLPREVEAFEDPQALFAGPDGLDAYRRLASLLPAVAAPSAVIALEFGAGQAGAVKGLFASAFPRARLGVRKDLAGIERVLIIDLAPLAR